MARKLTGPHVDGKRRSGGTNRRLVARTRCERKENFMNTPHKILAALICAGLVNTTLAMQNSQTQERVKKDEHQVQHRGDVRQLPDALKARLVELAGRPH